MRVLLFVATNIAVLVVLNVVLHLFGLDRALAGGRGLDLTGLMVMAALVGCAGSFVSLALSKWVAKRATRAQVIEQPRDATEAWLLATVERQARAAGIGVPEVAIYEAPDMNAFATGMDKNHALVAVSTGLMRNMDRDEVEAVLGHEVSHVANGDMVTLALIQGVLNTFVIFFSRIIGHVVDAALRGNRGGHHGYGPGYLIVSLVAQVVLGVLASIIVAWFSRRREFRADAGGARLAHREAMIGALERLRAGAHATELPQSMQAFGIHGGGGFARLFMSHPPLEERIRALQGA